MSEKYTVIIGESSGIGRDMAKIFAKKGKNLILIARRKERLEELKSKILYQNNNIDIEIIPCDLSDMDAVYELYEKLGNYNLEMLINNAGIGYNGKIINQDLKKISNMIKLNIEALTILSTLFANDYKDVEGTTLVNVTSTVGYGVTSKAPSYSATKFYVSAFTEALYWELKESGAKMRVKLLAPAMTFTEFLANALGKSREEAENINSMVAGNAGKKQGNTSEEIAEFLGELYESEEFLGYADTVEYGLHMTGPHIPHSFTKTYNPNLLDKSFKSDD